MRSLRHVPSLTVSLVGGAIILFTLSGCEPNIYDGPVAISQGPAGLRVAVCEDVDIKSIQVLVRPHTDHGDWETIWSATGSGHVGDNDPFLLSDGIVGLTPKPISVPSLAGGQVLDIYINNFVDADQTVLASFIVPTTGMPSEKWLSPAGAISPAPCPP